MRKLTVTALAAVLAVGGAAGAYAATRPAPAAPVAVVVSGAKPSTTPTFVRCDSITVGSVPTLDPVNPVCFDASDRTIVSLGSWACTDGTYLVSVDKPQGWYVSGKPFHATAKPSGSDASYRAAYHACKG